MLGEVCAGPGSAGVEHKKVGRKTVNSRNLKANITVHDVNSTPNASLNASPRHDTCAGIKSRTGTAVESLVGGGAARGGFASWSSRVGSAWFRLGAEGPELPQQSLHATLHGLGSGSGTLAAHWL